MSCILPSHPLTGWSQPKDIIGILKTSEDTEMFLHCSHACRYEVYMCVRMFLPFPSQGGFQNKINPIARQFW